MVWIALIVIGCAVLYCAYWLVSLKIDYTNEGIRKEVDFSPVGIISNETKWFVKTKCPYCKEENFANKDHIGGRSTPSHIRSGVRCTYCRGVYNPIR